MRQITRTATLLLLAACSGSESPTEPADPVRVVLTPPTLALDVGGSGTVAGVAVNASDPAVTYSSSSTAVATVTDAGVVTGLGPGTAFITATSVVDPRAKDSMTVAVREVVAVAVTPATLTLAAGETRQLTVQVTGTGTTAVTWSSTASGVAAVSETGLVTALSPGVATVRATSVADPTKTASVGVEVTRPTSRVQLAPGSQTVTGTTSIDGTAGVVTCEFPWTASVGGNGTAVWNHVSWTIASKAGSPSSRTDPVSGYGGTTSAFGPGTQSFRGMWHWSWTQNGQPRYLPFTLTLAMVYTEQSNGQTVTTAPITMACEPPPDGFTLGVSPSEVTLSPGGTATVAATITRTGGFTGAVELSVEGLPAGVTASSATVAAGATDATVALSASADAGAGSATLTLRGKAAGLEDATRSLTLTVTGGSGPGDPDAWLALDSDWYTGHSCAVRGDGAWFCWGNRFGNTTGSTSTQIVGARRHMAGTSFTDVAVGSHSACALAQDGRVYCIGSNATGVFGNGTTSSTVVHSPVLAASGATFEQIAGDSHHYCGLKSDGKAYCWGYNQSGEVGTGNGDVMVLTPRAVAGGLTFREIHAYQYVTCGLTAGGEVYCWGTANGVFLTDVGRRRDAPERVANGFTFARLGLGSTTACGTTPGGVTHCWGMSTSGALGSGSSPTTSYAGPVVVAGGHVFAEVALAFMSSCAITTAGAAYCWGNNGGGFNGDGMAYSDPARPLSRNAPSPVVGGHRFARIAVGSMHACGGTRAGELYCWGFASFNALGDGTGTVYGAEGHVSVPKRVQIP